MCGLLSHLVEPEHLALIADDVADGLVLVPARRGRGQAVALYGALQNQVVREAVLGQLGRLGKILAVIEGARLYLVIGINDIGSLFLTEISC